MPITEVLTHPEALTLTVIADFTVPPRRLWDAYADPRHIEKFWGPVEWPATFLRHDVEPGGYSKYCMTGPDGDRSCGYWEWNAVDAPHSFEVRDGFAHDDGTPNTDMPQMRMTFEFAESALGSRLTTTTFFNSLEELEQLRDMGMVEGLRSAMSQIDAVVEDSDLFAADRGTDMQLIGDNQARTSRIVRGTQEEVWQAHHDPDLLRRWQLGPDGWAMPICEVGAEVGQRHRTGWEETASGEQFGFTGVVKEFSPPYRSVTTESMWTPDDPDAANSAVTLNELTLTPVDGGTLVSLLITYPDAATREMILGTGMVAGMETSYARLDRELAGA